MHQARRAHVSVVRRWILGSLAAMLLAGGMVVARPLGWTDLCYAYYPGDVMWELLFCFVDPPPDAPDRKYGS